MRAASSSWSSSRCPGTIRRAHFDFQASAWTAELQSRLLKIFTPGSAASSQLLRTVERFAVPAIRVRARTGVFNLGGDLSLFAARIHDRDRPALSLPMANLAYTSCTET